MPCSKEVKTAQRSNRALAESVFLQSTLSIPPTTRAISLFSHYLGQEMCIAIVSHVLVDIFCSLRSLVRLRGTMDILILCMFASFNQHITPNLLLRYYLLIYIFALALNSIKDFFS